MRALICCLMAYGAWTGLVWFLSRRKAKRHENAEAWAAYLRRIEVRKMKR